MCCGRRLSRRIVLTSPKKKKAFGESSETTASSKLAKLAPLCAAGAVVAGAVVAAGATVVADSPTNAAAPAELATRRSSAPGVETASSVFPY